MPTPSIQTLRADAQQVLNLDSISAVRSVVAAALANANAGTPLNPNLTTQQLWNEFYQIVTQPKSDIESIIANQLMKFLYAPPAPGGVGADKQVIFNDGGVLAGDPQFLWNKTTNLLTVTGAATISGDLTVDTNVLKVDTTNNRVGIVNASPTRALDVVGSAIVSSEIRCSSFDTGTTSGDLYLFTSNRLSQTAAPTIECQNSSKPLIINHTGSQSMLFGIGSALQMTLNATGLGVGKTPVARLDVASTRAASVIGGIVGTTGTGVVADECQFLIKNVNTASGQNNGAGIGGLLEASASNKSSLLFYVDNGTAVTNVGRFDSNGNLGIGVTPSAWVSTFKAINVSSYAAFGGNSDDKLTLVGNNYYNDGTAKFIGNGYAGAYSIYQGAHRFQISTTNNSSGAGAALTFTQAMTLDASGRLILGTTGAYNAARLTVQSAGGAGGINTSIQNDNDNYYAINFRNSSGVSCGSISCGTSSTAFNTSSDYRLKEAVQPIIGALSRVSALKPSIYKWKVDGSNGEGFLAHELAEVVPFAVTGEKDAVNEDGSIKPQGVDMSRVVPILVAAIQELTARVQTLETR